MSDFGLATDFHWAHDGKYYEDQRKALLKKHGIDLDDGDMYSGTIRRRERFDMDEFPGQMDENDQAKSILTWRDKNRKKLAYSVVGTVGFISTLRMIIDIV